MTRLHIYTAINRGNEISRFLGAGRSAKKVTIRDYYIRIAFITVSRKLISNCGSRSRARDT